MARRGEGPQPPRRLRSRWPHQERGLRLVELPSDGAHLLLAQPVSVGDQCERVPSQRVLCEDIDEEEPDVRSAGGGIFSGGRHTGGEVHEAPSCRYERVLRSVPCIDVDGKDAVVRHRVELPVHRVPPAPGSRAKHQLPVPCKGREVGVSHGTVGLSGMTGWEQNDHAESFWQADIEDAASRLAKLLVAETADAAGGVRLARRVRASRPRAGAPRRHTGRRDRRHAARARGDDEPHADDRVRREDGHGRLRPQRARRRRQPVRHARGRDPLGSRRQRATSAASGTRWRATPARSATPARCSRCPTTCSPSAFGMEWFSEPGRDAGVQLAWPFAE